MSPILPRSRTRIRTSVLVLIAGVVLVAVLVTIRTVGWWVLRDHILSEARDDLNRLALVLAAQTDGALQNIDRVIRQTGAQIEQLDGTTGADAQTLHRLLATMVLGLPQVRALAFDDVDGTMIAHSREFPAPKINVADRDYFLVHKTMAADDLFISKLLRNRIDGSGLISLSRHIRRPTGAGFGGVVSAGIEIDYFIRLYRALHLPDGVSIVLQRLDGAVLVRYPETGGQGDPGPSPLGDLTEAAPPPSIYLAGDEAQVAVQRLTTLPLAVGLLAPTRVVMAIWVDIGVFVVMGTGASAAVIVILIALLRSQIARLEQREAARARLAAIVESSGDAIIGRDLDGIVVSWNHGAEQVFGYAAAEMIGSSAKRLVPPEGRAQINGPGLELPVGGGPDSLTDGRWETVRLRRDGTRIEVAVTVSPIRDTDGQVIGVSTIERDIAERRRAQEEIRRYRDHLEALVAERTIALTESNRQLAIAKETAEAASQAKSAFLANMSHEIRTPMNAILGFTQVMQRNSRLPAADRENLDIIQRNGRNLLALINDVLEMSKIEAGRRDIVSRTFDFAGLLQDLYVMFKISFEAKSLQWEIDCAPELPNHLIGDEAKLRQILINLVGNAVKFTERGGVVLRAWGVPPDQGLTTEGGVRLRIEVADTGCGIAPEDGRRLFDAFVQTPSGAAQGGTGLGLAISRRFARLMGGDITVASVPGRGSVFRLELPVEAGSASALVRPGTPQPVAGLRPGQGEVRILIADDKPDNRLFLRRLLAPLGFVLAEASNGQEAMAAWQGWRPALILMDMVMPVMDGHEATRRIKALPGGAVRIVALSARAFEEDRVAALAAGADAFLGKPVTAEELLEVIREQLGVEYEIGHETGREAGRDPGDDDREATAAAIPADLRRRMQDSVYRFDDVSFITMIGELPVDQGQHAATLRRLVARFDWDALTALLGAGDDA